MKLDVVLFVLELKPPESATFVSHYFSRFLSRPCTYRLPSMAVLSISRKKNAERKYINFSVNLYSQLTSPWHSDEKWDSLNYLIAHAFLPACVFLILSISK